MAAELSYISAFSSPIKVVHSKDINSQYDSLMKYPKPCTDQRKNDIMIGKKIHLVLSINRAASEGTYCTFPSIKQQMMQKKESGKICTLCQPDQIGTKFSYEFQASPPFLPTKSVERDGGKRKQIDHHECIWWQVATKDYHNGPIRIFG